MPVFTEENIQRIFGHEAAEDEDINRLTEYYFKNQTYLNMRAPLPLRILVGHKGIGKSALFSVAIQEDAKEGLLSISLRPDDISEVRDDQTDFNAQIKSWKTGLLRIIEKKVVENLGIARSDMQTKGQATGKALAVIKASVQPYLKDKIDFNPLQKAFTERFLKANALNVYIDDLDRGWQGRKTDISRISALLNAVRDLCNSSGELRFRIALRSDVYFAVRTSDESTDKLEGSVIWYSWINHEILALLVKRIETFFGRNADEKVLMRMKQNELATYLTPVMTPRFMGKGKWENAPIHRVLMSLIRKRPRDLVKLCTSAARHAHLSQRDIIITDDFQSVFEDYSQARVQDTINEHRTELPDIERLLMNMKPTKRLPTSIDAFSFTTDKLLLKVQRIMEQGKFRFSNGKEATAREIAAFMYKINFLTARKELPGEYVDRKYFEENRYLSSTLADFGYDWEIHPAYRWALQPDNVANLYNDIKLQAD